jgi:hypothetical protein
VREGDGVGEGLVGVDLRRRLPDAAELEQVDHAPVAPLQHRLAVAGRRGGGDHVARNGQSLVGVVRGPQRDAVGVQRGRESGGVVRAPRPLDGQGAELAGTSGIRVVQLDGQPCEQPCGRRQITDRRGRERLLEQAHRGGVGGGDDDRRPAMAEGRPGQQIRIARRAGELGGLDERSAGASAPPRAVVGVAQCEQHLTTLGVLGSRTRGQGRLVVRCRLGVGQRHGGLTCGGELPGRQTLAAGQHPGSAQVPGDLAGAHLAGVVPIGDDVGDLQVQPRAAGGRQRAHDRLADERMGERVAPPPIGRGDKRGLNRSVECLQDLDDGPANHAGQGRHVELEAGDGGHVERAPRRVVEARESVRDHVAHPRRGALDVTPGLLRLAQQLVEEERVAAAARSIAPCR